MYQRGNNRRWAQPNRDGVTPNDGGRPWTLGLVAVPLGRIDKHSLRFFETSERDGSRAAPAADPPSTDVTVSNYRLLGSYNRTDQDSPAALIPGSPPLWKNDAMPFVLQSDDKLCRDDAGVVFSDHDAGNQQARSILTMLAAVNECTPPDAFQWGASDIISDRNSLRHLLRWAGNWPNLKDFRIDLSLAGTKSVVFSRWKRDVREWAASWSYGFSYEEAQTKPAPGCEMSRKAGHDRVVSYDFGGMNVVCRFEADACIMKPASPELPVQLTGNIARTQLAGPVLASLGSLRFQRVGKLVPQGEVLELMTRTLNSVTQPRDELYAQMAFGGTEHLKIAIHNRGRFTQVIEEILGQSPPLVDAANRVQPSFKRLRVLLKAIQSLVTQYGRNKHLTLVNRGGQLEVFVREDGVVLPQEFTNVFFASHLRDRATHPPRSDPPHQFNPTRQSGSVGGRPWTQGLGPAALGRFNNRSLRFVGVTDLVGSQNASDVILPKAPLAVTRIKLLGSYNWTGQASPAVLIPGSPPIWKNDAMPITLQSDYELCLPDGGVVFDDHGAGTEQARAILAMLAAVNECTPAADFQWASSDLISDRNSLRNLLRWVGGWQKLADFRIDLSLVGDKSVVLTRWKQDTQERSSGRSYGFSYEDNQTVAAPGCELSRKAGHDRIVSYELGGLHIICRFEADACTLNSSSPDELSDQLARTHLNKPELASLGDLQFKRAGSLVPQEDVLELITRTPRSINRGRDELYAQMLFGATNHLKIAFHKGDGHFYQMREEVLGDYAPSEQALSSLKRLRILLAAIQELVVRHGHGKQLTLLNRGKQLEVFVREEGVVLPQEFRDVFA